MSSQQGGAASSGTSPAEDIVEPDSVSDAVSDDSDAVSDTTVPSQPPTAADEEEPTRSDAQISAAGGRILGEAEIAAVVDRSRVRRAPRYKRFAVLGGLLGVLVAAIATPLASYDSELAMMQGVSPGTLFLVLLGVLVPLGILVSCAVAMIGDRAARVPERAKRKRRRKEPR